MASYFMPVFVCVFCVRTVHQTLTAVHIASMTHLSRLADPVMRVFCLHAALCTYRKSSAQQGFADSNDRCQGLLGVDYFTYMA